MLRTGCRRARLIGLMAALGVLACAAGASAASPVVKAGTPFASGPPAVAVESDGTAVVAWANTRDLAGANNFVQYCVLPVGAKACAHSGDLTPADGALAIDGTQVIAFGGTIVILADVFGTQGTQAGDYAPEQEWQSTDGGATWTIVNGGLSVASANLSANTGPLNAVIVPGTGVLGYGWETAGGPPTFNAFPLAAPPECSKAKPCPFATLEPPTNPDTLANAGGALAAEAGAHPGILGVFNASFSDGGPLSCPSSTPDGLAFAFGSGNQSTGNSYNLSPGSPGSAWINSAALGECGMHFFAVAGGPKGFGIIGDNEATSTTVFQPFQQATRTFGPKVTVSTRGEIFPALSEDGAGNFYATYLNDGTGGPVALSYSADGGKTWSGPSTLDAFNAQDQVTSAVNGAGQGWVTWRANGSVFAQPFTAADAVSAPSAGSSATSNGVTVTITVTCSSLPCTVTITITAPVGPARDARARKPAVLAKGTVTFRSHKRGKVKLRLTAAGKRFFKTHHHTAKLKLALSERVHGHLKQRTKTIKVKYVKPRK